MAAESEMSVEEVVRQNAKKWPANWVARSEFKRFSGGVYARGTLANLDSRGEGIPGRFKIGRETVYPLSNAVEWLIGRIRKAG